MIDPQAELPPKGPDTARQERHALRDRAADLTGWERLGECGRARTQPGVELWRGEGGGVHYRGLATCGSIWTCPVCSTKIATRRAEEVCELVEAHEADPAHAVYMATFTIRHRASDRAKALREMVALAWRKLQNRRGWRAFKDDFGVIGTVRALEVTHGKKNGWHPHVHVLIFTDRPIKNEAQAAAALYWEWSQVVAKLGGTTERKAFHMRRASKGVIAAEYVAKWGAGHEVAKGAHKDAAGRSVWDLLKASEHDASAGRLFVEYAEAFKGARHLTYSRGLREGYGLRDAASDQELAEADEQLELHDPETGEVIAESPERLAFFDHATWAQVVGRGWTGLLLDIASADGREGVETWLKAHGLGSYYAPDEGEFAPSYHPPPTRPMRRAFDPASGKSARETIRRGRYA